MSEGPAATTNGQVPESVPAPDKRIWAESVVKEVLRLLDIRARLELKDAPENGIAVAIHPEAESPALQSGKRTSLVDALQFLANKIVNRPNSERRWISLGVGGFPEPRPPPAERPARPPAPVSAAPVASARPSAPAPRTAAAPRPGRSVEVDELSISEPPDAQVAALGKLLAEKSAKHGRHYAALAMSLQDRSALLKGAQGAKGQSVRAEGEGRNRRVVFTPDTPAPMPKRALPQDDDEE
jgi:predicted RNA-binding protein Jag